MRIAMLSTMYLRYPNDTRGLMVSEFNRLLRKLGHHVEVVAPGDPDTKSEEIIAGIPVHRFTYFWPKKFERLAYGPGIPTNLRTSWLARLQVPLFGAAFFLKAFKHSKRADLIHCQWLPTGLIGVLVGKVRRKPVVVTVRRLARSRVMRLVNRFVLKRADLVLFNSTYMQDESLSLATPKRFRVFNNSLDTEKFKPLPKERLAQLREKSGIPPGAKVVLSLGLLIEKKGLKYLIEAIPAILKSHPDTYFIIAGHGNEAESLKKMVERFKLQERVIFTGRVEAHLTPYYFNLADLFVCPSIIDSKGNTETLGVVLMEALACGTPVVASKVGGVVDVVTDEVGILVPPKDPLALHEAICDLLADDKRRQALGAKGRERIVEKFGDQAALRNLERCYQMVMPQQLFEKKNAKNEDKKDETTKR